MSKSTMASNGFENEIKEKVDHISKRQSDAIAYLSQAQKFYANIEKDDAFATYRSEVLKLTAVIGQIIERIEPLKKKYIDAVSELLSAENQGGLDLNKINSDAATMKALKSQILRAESLLQGSSKREELAKFELRQLKQDIANLQATLKQGVGLSQAQERTINELIATKDQYTRDLQYELDRIVELRASITDLADAIDKTELNRKQIEKEIVILKEKNASKKLEIDMELKNKDKLERDLKEMRVIVTMKNNESATKQLSINRASDDIAQIESQIRHQRASIEKLLKDQEMLGTRTVKLQHDFDEQMDLTHELKLENETTLAELKIKERELNNHRVEIKRITRTKEGYIKKCRLLEEAKQQAEDERKRYRTNNELLAEQVDSGKRYIESLKKMLDDLKRENDILNSSLEKTLVDGAKVHSLLLLQKKQQASLELECARMKKEDQLNDKQQKLLELDMQHSEKELNALEKQRLAVEAQQKAKETKIIDYQKQIQMAENKLKYQQNLYETVQSDKKLLAKQLIDSQIAISEMKRKLKIMNFQINGFKEDLDTKEVQLNKANIEASKLAKDTDVISDEIKTLQTQNELAIQYIKTQMAEEYKLDQFVKEAEVERDRQQKALELIINERDNLSSQLRIRDQELVKVYDKIKTQSLVLFRGEMHYNDKLKQINRLRLHIMQRKQEIETLSKATENSKQRRNEEIQQQSNALEKQLKIKALQEQVLKPINVHRWRSLEGSQPQTYSSILFLQTLQKMIIEKSKEEQLKSESIEIKERLYIHLKTLLAKQAGPEVHQQINEFRILLKKKKEQLRHVDTELLMYKSQIEEYKHSIEQSDKGILELKQQYMNKNNAL